MDLFKLQSIIEYLFLLGDRLVVLYHRKAILPTIQFEMLRLSS